MGLLFQLKHDVLESKKKNPFATGHHITQFSTCDINCVNLVIEFLPAVFEISFMKVIIFEENFDAYRISANSFLP